MSSFAGLHVTRGPEITGGDVAGVVEAVRRRCSSCEGVMHDASTILAQAAYCRIDLPRLGEIRQDGPREIAAVVDANFGDRSTLEAAFGLSDASDQQLLTAAYERWGDDCVSHMEGDFAFVLWDPRRRVLLCGHDALGVRPLYYARTSRGLAFATDLPLLLGLPGVHREVNEEKVADFLLGTHSDPAETFYVGIQRLPAAHILVASRKGTVVRRYWQPDPEFEIRRDLEDSYSQEYRQAFVRSVRDRLPKSTRMGCQLSGGFDSSSITCVVRDLLRSDDSRVLDTFSLTFDEVPQSDEREYIRAVADLPGIRNHCIRGDTCSPFDSLDLQLAAFGEPPASPNLYLAHPLYTRARETGVDILFDGYFGDSVVGHGTQYLTELFGSMRWRRLAIEIVRLATRNAPRRRRPRYAAQLIKQYILAPYVSPHLKMSALLLPGTMPRDASGWLVNPDLLNRTKWKGRAIERIRREGVDQRSVRRAQLAELESQEYLLGFDMITQMGRAHDVSIRFPFAERRLFEYCVALPSEQKYHEGWTRAYARRAMEPYLPEKILRRYGKTYLHHSFFRSLLVLGRSELEVFLNERLPAASSFVNVSDIKKKYRRVQAGRAPKAAAWSLWNAVLLTRWLEIEATRKGARV